jgi:hypothetical protein
MREEWPSHLSLPTEISQLLQQPPIKKYELCDNCLHGTNASYVIQGSSGIAKSICEYHLNELIAGISY